MHIPVLLHEVINGLNPKPKEKVVDGTLGGAGHAMALLKAIGREGILIGFDEDEDAIVRAKKALAGIKGRVILARSNFRNILAVLKKHKITGVNKILFDLGLSSYQL